MTRVKICGLSRTEDINTVNRALPDFIGFVFAKSRRQVDEATAAMLKERLDARIRPVGVFVNQNIEYIAGICQKGIIDLVQLHGDEDSGYIRRLKEACGGKGRGLQVIKAVSVENALPKLPEGADFLLFDTASVKRGGTGRAFDWSVLKAYEGTPYFLAGGLGISNVAEAVAALRPYCVDVSSGVETDGIKDAEKINKFVQQARRIH